MGTVCSDRKTMYFYYLCIIHIQNNKLCFQSKVCQVPDQSADRPIKEEQDKGDEQSVKQKCTEGMNVTSYLQHVSFSKRVEHLERS